jgi:hypothetical protein
LAFFFLIYYFLIWFIISLLPWLYYHLRDLYTVERTSPRYRPREKSAPLGIHNWQKDGF